MADDAPEPISQGQQVPAGAYAGPITTTTEGGDTATSTVRKPAPGELAAIQGAEQNTNAAADLQQQAVEAKAAGAAGTADLQDKATALAQQQAADAVTRNDDFHQRLAEAEHAHAQAYMDLEKTPYHKLFEGETTGHKIGRSIGMLLTAASGSVPANQALDAYMDNLVKNDFAKQKANREDALNLAKIKGEDVNQLYSQWERGNAIDAVKEQKAREAIAQEIIAQGTRAGIPVDKLLGNVTVKQMLAGGQQAKANSLGHFDASFSSQREINPKVSTVEGKLQGGKGGAAKPPIAEVDSADVDLVTKQPLSPQERDAARRILTQDPGLLEKAKGIISGGQLPDYLAKLTPDSQARVQAAVRMGTPLAEVVTNNKRAGTNKDALTSVLLSHIPSTDDTPEARKRKTESLLKVTGRVGAFQQGVTPSPPQAAPAAPPGLTNTGRTSGGKPVYKTSGGKLVTL